MIVGGAVGSGSNNGLGLAWREGCSDVDCSRILNASCFAFKVALCFDSALCMWKKGVTVSRPGAERAV